MKFKLLLICLMFVVSAVASAQDATTVSSEAAGQPAACSPASPQSFRNVQNPATVTNLFAIQGWALHNRNQLFEGPDADVPNRPAFTWVAGPTALVLATDTMTAWGVNTTANSKFAWLVEQNSASGGQFGIVIGGETAADTVNPDLIQGFSQAAGRGCSAIVGNLIGDCGAGANRPCITSVSQNTPNTSTSRITLSWAMPATTNIMFSRDTEDGEAYSFDFASNALALDSIITGWQIFFRNTGAPGTQGVRTDWTLVADSDGNIDNLTAIVDVPEGAGNTVLAVAPIFDDVADPAVTLANVVSGASQPIIIDPVNFSKFTGRRVRPGLVELTWVTASEVDALGFDLYRSSKGSDWVKINAQLIPARGVGGAGATYIYSDQLSSKRPMEYQYKVVEVSTTSLRANEMTTTVPR